MFITELSVMNHLPDRNEGIAGYRIDFLNEEQFRICADQFASLPEDFAFIKEARKKKHRKEGNTRDLTKRVSSAVHNIMVNPENKSIEFDLEPPQSDAISVSDLVIKFLKIPVSSWNLDVTITKIRAPVPE
jgi:hypothetical protein